MAETCPLARNQYEELAAFLASFPKETKGQAYWLRRFLLWWDHNPTFTEGLDRGWVLRKQDTVVGFCGMIPTWFQQGGREDIVFSATTWRVLPEFRSQSLSLFFKLLNAAKQSIVFCTTSSDTTVSVLKALKFQLIPRADERRSVVAINCGRVAAARLGDRPGGAVLVTVLAGGLALWQTARLRFPDPRPAGLEVREVGRTDASFDRLWERTRGLFKNTNVRRAEVLNWFCFSNQDFEKRLFGCYQAGDLLGYCMARPNQANRYELRVFECMDLWLDPSHENVLGVLVGAVTAHARAQGYDLVAVPHFHPLIASGLARLGLIPIRAPERHNYFKAQGPAGATMSTANSYFVTAQGDDGL